LAHSTNTCFALAKEIRADKGCATRATPPRKRRWGLESLVTQVAAVGAFSMTCITAATFQIDPPANDPTPLAG
jgi:hypothetical protein